MNSRPTLKTLGSGEPKLESSSSAAAGDSRGRSGEISTFTVFSSNSATVPGSRRFISATKQITGIRFFFPAEIEAFGRISGRRPLKFTIENLRIHLKEMIWGRRSGALGVECRMSNVLPVGRADPRLRERDGRAARKGDAPRTLRPYREAWLQATANFKTKIRSMSKVSNYVIWPMYKHTQNCTSTFSDFFWILRNSCGLLVALLFVGSFSGAF